jgi:hypothetical protein
VYLNERRDREEGCHREDRVVSLNGNLALWRESTGGTDETQFEPQARLAGSPEGRIFVVRLDRGILIRRG